MPPVADQQAELFASYVKDKKILIADTNATSRSGLHNALTQMGAQKHNIVMASSFPQALAELERVKPQIVLADYDMGNRCGLDLLQHQRQHYPESKQCLFVLVTGNTSQTAVAKAAEEDVDTYILKPFTGNLLRGSLMKAAIAKVRPSEYQKTIEEGKKQLTGGQLDEAIATFQKATKLDPSPSLACFYLGQAQLVKEALGPAEGSFQKGLTFNKIHYKCMVGLFEILMSQKRFAEAYDVVKKISQYFPANPQRLTSVLKLAILTQSYDDVERYYQIFTKIDERSEEIIKYVCAALVICGKYYLQRKVPSRGLELFGKAAITAQGRAKILQEIIVTLLDFKMGKDAQDYLKRFPPEQQSSVTYLSLKLLVADSLGADPGVIIGEGRKIIAADLHDPILYELLIRRARDTKLGDYAQSLLDQALKRWPEQKARFAKLAPAGAAAVSKH